MKLLVIDRDSLTAHMMSSRLAPLGHEVVHMAAKPDGVDQLVRSDFDAVFIDPSPQTDLKPLIVNIRRQIRYAPYMVLMSETLGLGDALTNGLNAFLPKPLEPQFLDRMIDNAARLQARLKSLAADTEDFPSAGGIIAKSAFNQLFLSCMDRADRYGEKSFALFISLSSYKMIVAERGVSTADVAAAALARHLVRLRRVSDIIGQTKSHEYALLLLRPQYESEPIDAANRFADQLSQATDIANACGMTVEIEVMLMDLPTGAEIVRHVVTLSA
jgi:DNA-binding response OmpR family regulator